MENKIICNSDILTSLFNKKENEFLKDIDKKIEELKIKKKIIKEKEIGINKLFEKNQIDEKIIEKINNFIRILSDKLKDLEIRIKELNHAIIRLILDNESSYKYQTQNLNQTVIFVKDKIDEYFKIENELYKNIDSIDEYILNIINNKEEKNYLSRKTENLEKKPQKSSKTTEKIKDNINEEISQNVDNNSKEKNNIISKDVKIKENEKNISNTCKKNVKRTRNGSALNSNVNETFEKEFRVLNNSIKKSNKKNNIISYRSTILDNNKLNLKNDDNTQDIEENRVLLISEKEGKVFLPFKKSDIMEFLEFYPDNYKDYKDVIEKEFILPIECFTKNQSLSRFREMYELIRNREEKSMVEAMKLSTKYMFKYELNPAIIAACDSMEEFDKYMYCLEENKLEEFDLFEIKYELNLL